MKFYNKTDHVLNVKDAGGDVVVGPFEPGSKATGPFFDVDGLPDFYRELWKTAKKIEILEDE